MELALGLTAVGAIAAARFAWLRLPLATFGPRLGRGFAIGFGPVRGTRTVTPLIVAALAVAILRSRTMAGMTFPTMGVTLLAVVAVAALLPVMTTVGLESTA